MAERGKAVNERPSQVKDLHLQDAKVLPRFPPFLAFLAPWR